MQKKKKKHTHVNQQQQVKYHQLCEGGKIYFKN